MRDGGVDMYGRRILAKFNRFKLATATIVGFCIAIFFTPGFGPYLHKQSTRPGLHIGDFLYRNYILSIIMSVTAFFFLRKLWVVCFEDSAAAWVEDDRLYFIENTLTAIQCIPLSSIKSVTGFDDRAGVGTAHIACHDKSKHQIALLFTGCNWRRLKELIEFEIACARAEHPNIRQILSPSPPGTPSTPPPPPPSGA